MALSPAHVQGHSHDRFAKWSLELASASVVVIAVLALLSVWDVRDTDWGSWLVPIGALSGLAAGIGAGATAIVAIVKGERSTLLVVPLVLAVVCALAIVGEAFIWE